MIRSQGTHFPSVRTDERVRYHMAADLQASDSMFHQDELFFVQKIFCARIYPAMHQAEPTL